MGHAFQRNTRGHWRHCSTREPWQKNQTWKRRNEPQKGRQTVSETQQREGRAAATHSSHVGCSVLWDWVVQKAKMLLQTPLRAGASAARSCPPGLNWLQDLPSKPCCSQSDGGMDFHSCLLTQAEDMTFVLFF